MTRTIQVGDYSNSILISSTQTNVICHWFKDRQHRVAAVLQFCTFVDKIYMVR